MILNYIDQDITAVTMKDNSAETNKPQVIIKFITIPDKSLSLSLTIFSSAQLIDLVVINPEDKQKTIIKIIKVASYEKKLHP